MKGFIKSFKSWLGRTFVSLNVQFHETVISEIQTVISTIDLLQNVWNDFLAAANALSDSFKRAKKYMQTPILVELDKTRDGVMKRIVAVIESIAAAPLNDAEKQAGELLKFLADIYRGAPNRDYESNTALVTHFLNAASSATLAQAITTLNLAAALDFLRTKNEEFQTVYVARLHEKEQHRIEGNTNELRKVANARFSSLCDSIADLAGLNISAVHKTKINEIGFKLNAIIDQYEVTYHRHAGITGHGSGSGGSAGSGGDGPDIDTGLIPPDPYE
jgi:hypothetical protein